jgi:hypothetical protein
VSQTELERYSAACDYPGRLDEAAVAENLGVYLHALGVERKIVRLPSGWRLEEHPALLKYTNAILDDLVKRNPAFALDARAARDAIAARDARAARAALAALAALDARDARAARAARAARDAIDAILGGLQRFAAWCIQAYGWSWWRFDLSWISTTYLGALQTKNEGVQRWSHPLYEAYIAGAWLLHWTEDTLYWVAKPTVHLDPAAGTRRLHNEHYAALESDVENLYFWHGVLVPAFVVVRPDWITVKHIEDETNAEVRRVMTERYGEGRYIIDSGLKPIARDEFGELFRKDFEGDSPLVYVKVKNSTAEPDGSFRDYFLSVNPDHYKGAAGKIPHAAVASTWRKTPSGAELFFKKYEDYRPEIET